MRPSNSLSLRLHVGLIGIVFSFCLLSDSLLFSSSVFSEENDSPSAVISVGQSPVELLDAGNLAKSLAHYMLGTSYDLYDMPEEALEEYQQALLFDKENYAVHLHLGINYARIGKLSQAVEELNSASKLKPEDMQNHYLLALVYSYQKKFEKAAEEYEIILKHFSQSDPENNEIYVYLAQLYFSQGKYDKAIEQFEILLSKDPQNSDVMYSLGSLYLEMGNRQKAIELFKAAVQTDPNHDGSLNSLAYIYAEDGVNLDEALDLIKRAINISPDNGAYLDSQGWIYYKKNMYDNALEVLQKAESLLKDPVIYDHLGDVYFKMNEMEKAQKYWELSLKLLPDQNNITKKLLDLKNLRLEQESLSSQRAH